MVDVLLTHSNHLFHDRKQVQKMQPYPPLQTLLAAACLRRRGYTVALFDPTLEEPESGFERALENHRPRLVAVIEDNFNFLTKMCLLHNRELAFWFAQTAGCAGVPAIVNGADASDHAAEYLNAGFACVLRGEVEETLDEVVRFFLAATGTLEATQGIAYLTPASGQLRYTAPRAPMQDLNLLPACVVLVVPLILVVLQRRVIPDAIAQRPHRVHRLERFEQTVCALAQRALKLLERLD